MALMSWHGETARSPACSCVPTIRVVGLLSTTKADGRELRQMKLLSLTQVALAMRRAPPSRRPAAPRQPAAPPLAPLRRLPAAAALMLRQPLRQPAALTQAAAAAPPAPRQAWAAPRCGARSSAATAQRRPRSSRPQVASALAWGCRRGTPPDAAARLCAPCRRPPRSPRRSQVPRWVRARDQCRHEVLMNHWF